MHEIIVPLGLIKPLEQNGDISLLNAREAQDVSLDPDALKLQDGMCQCEVGFGFGSVRAGRLRMYVSSEQGTLTVQLPDEVYDDRFELKAAYCWMVGERVDSRGRKGGTLGALILDMGMNMDAIGYPYRQENEK